jgi:enterochelin esterase family protein
MKSLIVFFSLICLPGLAQDYTEFTQAVRELSTGTAEDIAERWEKLADGGKIPLAVRDSVAFLYRGEAKSVMWMGDFNGWGYDKTFRNKGTRIAGTDIWILKASFPSDARLDYKIVINESNWILDPVNPYQQWSGVGGGSPNSELRMPAWKPEPTGLPVSGVLPGRVRKDILIDSKQLGYQVTYSVYTPGAYREGDPSVYPVMYVTDGYEYMHENMGNMITILNNLIHQKMIKPVIVVFIDHREPVNRANNRRMQELAMNERYLNFFTQELIPKVEGSYRISRKPEERAILGTSMGGLNAAYFSFSRPEIFGLAGIQSPSFWFQPEIYSFCDNPDHPPVKTFMTAGLLNDTREGAEKMKTILDKNTCTFQYKEVNQGHSWGNWRDLIDDILIYFFAAN